MKVKKELTISRLNGVFFLLIFCIITSILGACSFKENTNECGKAFFLHYEYESIDILDKQQKFLGDINKNFREDLINTQNESIISIKSTTNDLDIRNKISYKEEDISINMMWLNKDKVGSFTHKISGYDFIEILLPFPEILVTGNDIEKRDIKILDVIKGWNQKGWLPLFWIDSENVDRVEVYEKPLEILKSEFYISFIIGDIQDLEFVKQYKNWIDKMPVYPKVDLCRMLTIMEGKGLQVYADLSVCPMDLEDLMSDGTARLTDYVNRKERLMNRYVQEKLNEISILQSEYSRISKECKKMGRGIFSFEKEELYNKNKLRKLDSRKRDVKIRVNALVELIQEFVDIRTHLNLKNEIRKYKYLDIERILSKEGFIIARNVAPYCEEYRIGMHNENSFFMVNTENHKTMCALKKVFHEGSILIFKHINSGTKEDLNSKKEYFYQQIYSLYHTYLNEALTNENFSSVQIKIVDPFSCSMNIPSYTSNLRTKLVHVVEETVIGNYSLI